MSGQRNNESLSIARYIGVGAFNTLFGYSIILSAMYLGINPYLSNLIGYGLGLILSFFLQKMWVFPGSGNSASKFLKFILVFGIAYLANLAVLLILVNKISLNVYFSQMLAGITYVTIGYCCNRFFVFKVNK